MPLNDVPLGLDGILEFRVCNSLLEDLKAQTSEVGSFHVFSAPCRWDLFSECVVWCHIQLRNFQRRLPSVRFWVRNLSICCSLCSRCRSALLLKVKMAFGPMILSLSIKNHS